MITDARAIKNPLESGRFRVEFNGYPPALFTKCSLPEDESKVVKMKGGGQTLSKKNAGGEELSEFTLEAIVSADGTDRMFWRDWRMQVRTHDEGQYYRDGSVTILGPNYEPKLIWDLQDAWPKKVKIEEFKSDSDEELVRLTITMECNDCIPRVR
jgi:phage tail-like protein